LTDKQIFTVTSEKPIAESGGVILKIVSMNNFQCSKCGMLLQSEKAPNAFGCSAGGSGRHDWKDLGEVGSLNYQCTRCGLLVKSAKEPRNAVTCKVTGRGHQWRKL
jgi:rubredoxin